MDPIQEHQKLQTRRQFFGKSILGLGTGALASLLNQDRVVAQFFPGNKSDDNRTVGLAELPHFAARAKRIIYLFQNGAPTHVDLFDYKPALYKLHGQPVPQAAVTGKRFSTMTGKPDGKLILAPIEDFHQYGQSGAWVSDLLPHTSQIVDDICFLKGMHTEQVNHSPAISFFLTGAEMPGRPSMGAWLTYDSEPNAMIFLRSLS